MAPIFTPARSVSESELNEALPQQIQRDLPVHSFTAEQTKEAFDVARNSIELLTTVLSSSPQQDALQVFFNLVLLAVILKGLFFFFWGNDCRFRNIKYAFKFLQDMVMTSVPYQTCLLSLLTWLQMKWLVA